MWLNYEIFMIFKFIEIFRFNNLKWLICIIIVKELFWMLLL